MKIAIVGSRRKHISDPYAAKVKVYEFVDSLPADAVVVSGAEPTGVDSWAARAARLRGLQVIEHPAIWRREDGSIDKGAGFKRNAIIEKDSDECHAFWNSQSPGTGHTIELFRKAGKPVTIHELIP